MIALIRQALAKKEHLRMRTPKPTLHAFGLIGVTAILAGCSGGIQSSALEPSSPGFMGLESAQGSLNLFSQSGRSPSVMQLVTQHPDHSASWVSPDVKKTRELLFASDPTTNDVYIYALPSLKLKGTRTGFDFPEGECNDNAGHVWVTQNGSLPSIVKLSRTGSMLRTLTDPGYPSSCAVDPTTGNLAVANSAAANSSAADIYIYPRAKSTPVAVSDPSMHSYFFAGYDNSGNLFADGVTESGGFVLSECAAGCVGSSMTTISISGGKIYFPGFVQWYAPGGYLAVGDQECNHLRQSCVYAVSISGSSGTITGTTMLKNPKGNPVCDMVEGVINPVSGMNLLGADYESGTCKDASTEDNWPFPAGGSPTHSNDGSQISQPIGAAISIK